MMPDNVFENYSTTIHVKEGDQLRFKLVDSGL